MGGGVGGGGVRVESHFMLTDTKELLLCITQYRVASFITFAV